MRARQPRGRVSSEHSGVEERYVMLLVAVVERAWLDLALPTRHKSTNYNYPSALEKESAADFLQAMYESATHRQIE